MRISTLAARSAFFRIAADRGLVEASVTLRQSISLGDGWGHDEVSSWTDDFIMSRYGRRAV